MSATLTPAAAEAIRLHAFFASLENPVTAALFDVRLTIDTLMSGSYNDADPRVLLEGAIRALQSARAAFES